MRVTFRVTLGALLAGLLGTFLLVGIVTGPADASARPVHSAAEPLAARPVGVVAVVPVAAVHPVVGPKATVAASPTTDYNKGQQAADAAVAKRKLYLGIACVALLLIVYIGHRAKGRHILRVKNLQNAKG